MKPTELARPAVIQIQMKSIDRVMMPTESTLNPTEVVQNKLDQLETSWVMKTEPFTTLPSTEIPKEVLIKDTITTDPSADTIKIGRYTIL